MAALRTTRSSARPAAVVAVLTLLLAVTALLAFSGTAHAQDRDCGDFEYQEDAQAVLDADPSDPNRLDGLTAEEKDGVACESLPRRGTVVSVVTTTSAAPTTSSTAPITTTSTTPSTTVTTSPTSSSNSDDDSDSDSDDSDSDSDDDSSSDTTDDKNCPDFASQADAQAHLTAHPSDPDNLDSDDDGIACEEHFGQTGQQVQVHPAGGVDTGGDPADA